MSRRVVAWAVLVAAFGAYAASAQSRSARDERANRALARWLEQDVAYIITDQEKDAFKALTTDEEREQFIEQFWLRRDPTPDTIENEFREDHYTRIAYANEHFASGIPGWKTDRGRIYILHGPPDNKETHPAGGFYERPFEDGGGMTSTYPFEIWNYRYLEGLGTNINLEFVDPTMTGEYRLAMGPHEKDALARVPGAGYTLEELLSDNPEEMRADRVNGMTPGQDQRVSPFDRLDLYTRAFEAPDVKFKDLEAIVTTKLSYNLLPFEMRADFVRVTEETVLTPITIQIQNKDIAFQETQGIHQAVLNVFGRITNVNGRVAQTFEDTISLNIPDALFRDQLDSFSVHQKVIPLPPALYKIDLVIKDLNSNNVGTITKQLPVPRFPEGQLEASSLILADLIQPLPSRQVGSGPFVLGSLKVRPNVKQEFTQNSDLNYWVQIYNLKVDEANRKPAATVETLITRDGREVEKIVENTSELSGAAQQMTVQKTIPLASFEPGEYAIQVRVTDNLSGDVISKSSRFMVRETQLASSSAR